MLLLALVGVERQEILTDYTERRAYARRLGRRKGYPGYAEEMAGFLAERGTSAAELLTGLLADVDLEARLHAGGAGGRPPWSRCAAAIRP